MNTYVSKQVTIGEFFKGITLPGDELVCQVNGEYLTYDDSGERLIDSLGRYGYNTWLSGAYVCYTCGHLCDCGWDGE